MDICNLAHRRLKRRALSVYSHTLLLATGSYNRVGSRNGMNYSARRKRYDYKGLPEDSDRLMDHRDLLTTVQVDKS